MNILTVEFSKPRTFQEESWLVLVQKRQDLLVKTGFFPEITCRKVFRGVPGGHSVLFSDVSGVFNHDRVVQTGGKVSFLRSVVGVVFAGHHLHLKDEASSYFDNNGVAWELPEAVITNRKYALEFYSQYKYTNI